MSEAAQTSFRDPDGFLIHLGSRIFRCVLPNAAAGAKRFLCSPLALQWMEQGVLCRTKECSTAELCGSDLSPLPAGALILEHQPISFPNYPYEWAPEMLAAAGRLTLELAETAALSGYSLKDATPYNIMFEGTRPVFLDLLSFEDRDPKDVLWRPYAQFMRTFAYPLLVNRYLNLRLDETLLAHREGLEPERMLSLCPWWRLGLPPFLGAVTLPALLASAAGEPANGVYRGRDAGSAGEARFVLSRLFRRAKKLIGTETRPTKSSRWSRYMHAGQRYSAQEMGAKEKAVRDAVATYQPQTVLDIGCNTGHFSLLAAEMGAHVVSVDGDADAIGQLWRNAGRMSRPVLPLVIDIARPPGAIGWANSECASFLDRAASRFRCVLMLALLHHLIVNERVPLSLIFSLAAKLTTDLLIIEYVDPSDEQFQRIARGRESLHRKLSESTFEAAAKERFEITRSVSVTPSRRIYTLRKKS